MKFYRLHNDIEHHTNECWQVKDTIENIIKLGWLYHYSKGEVRPQLPPTLLAQLGELIIN